MPGKSPFYPVFKSFFFFFYPGIVILAFQSQASCLQSTFSFLLLRFTSALVYQGLVMRLGIAGGNLYLDFFISGAVELPAALLILLTIDRIGRRLPFVISNIVAGVACLITAFLPEGNSFLRFSRFLIYPRLERRKPCKDFAAVDQSKKPIVVY